MRTPEQCAAEKDRLFALLTATFPDFLLQSRATITRYLNALGLRTLGGRPIYWNRVLRWAEYEGFPLVPGSGSKKPQRYMALTSTLAVHAWIASRVRNGSVGVFACWDDHVIRTPERLVPDGHVHVRVPRRPYTRRAAA